jgi:hypothetical protein
MVPSICRFLKKNRFRDICSVLSVTQHGIDIKALTPNGKRRVSIEVKGETSSKSHTSRFGKPFNSTQVNDHVSRAFYCAARDVSMGMLAALAFPKNEAHIKQVHKILPVLKKLHIEVFWVLPNKRVETDRIWRTWAGD